MSARDVKRVYPKPPPIKYVIDNLGSGIPRTKMKFDLVDGLLCISNGVAMSTCIDFDFLKQVVSDLSEAVEEDK